MRKMTLSSTTTLVYQIIGSQILIHEATMQRRKDVFTLMNSVSHRKFTALMRVMGHA